MVAFKKPDEVELEAEVEAGFHNFNQLPLAVFEGGLPRNVSVKDSGCAKSFVLQSKMCLGRRMGQVCRNCVRDSLVPDLIGPVEVTF